MSNQDVINQQLIGRWEETGKESHESKRNYVFTSYYIMIYYMQNYDQDGNPTTIEYSLTTPYKLNGTHNIDDTDTYTVSYWPFDPADGIQKNYVIISGDVLHCYANPDYSRVSYAKVRQE